MIKFTCFTDTCSYINLTLFEYKEGTLLDLLREKVNVRICPEINRIEIPNHENDKTPKINERINEVYHTNKLSYKEYEKRIFNTQSITGAGDKGEKDNFSALIDSYLFQKTKGLIFLSDDYKAINSIFNEWKHAFPIFRIWTSFDVVLFLYIDNVIISKDIAVTALKTLNAGIAPNNPRTKIYKTQQRIDRLNKYLTFLELINNLKR
ncbi:MAG: hypothetical protein ABR980_11500 [Ignavibacteriaceae bacterium]|jgi:hypothetical protein